MTSMHAFMTNQMKDDLRACGFSEEQLAELTRQEGDEILAAARIVVSDNREVRKMIEIIVAQARAATKHLKEPGLLQVSLLHPLSEEMVPYRYALDNPKLVEQMTREIISASEAGHNTYIEARTVRRGLLGKQRGEATDTVAVFALVVDSDADKNEAWTPNVPVSLGVQTSPPSNEHSWLFFERALDYKTGQTYGARLRAATKTDKPTGNICQPYRIAGTVNYPSDKKKQRGRVNVSTRILGFDPKVLWTPEQFEQAFPKSDGGGPTEPGGDPQAPIWRIAKALSVIPHNDNDPHSADYWKEIGQTPGRTYMIQIGMAVKAASGGSAEGFALFDKWRKGAPDYNADMVKKKWEGFRPTCIGFGTLKFYADKAHPGWDTPKDPRALPFHRHGEKDPLEDRAWTVDGLIPEIGTGVIAGQWGTLKTFVALDLTQCVMTGRPFLGFDIVRRGGALLLALEGQSEVAIRIQGALEKKGSEYHTGAPFYWCEACPPLTDPKTAEVIIATAKAAAADFKQRFNLPLSLILIDSLVAGAGYRKEGQDNDAAVTHAIMMVAAQASRALGCFVFVIDHFGKDTNVGTRGSSVKEGDADVIFACLGDRSEGGKVSNSRLAVRKRRAGPNGEEFPFRGRVVDMGVNPKTGKTETTLVIDWGDAGKYTAPKKDDWGRGRGVKLLRRTIMSLLVDCGEQIKPFADGPLVRALKLKLVEDEFFKSYATTGETDADKKAAKRVAFKRALEQAGDKVVTREVGGVDYVWLAHAGPADKMGAGPAAQADPPESA
jgi:hypothetical protein